MQEKKKRKIFGGLWNRFFLWSLRMFPSLNRSVLLSCSVPHNAMELKATVLYVHLVDASH